MNSGQKRYLLRNCRERTIRELASQTNIPEEEIRAFLENAGAEICTKSVSKPTAASQPATSLKTPADVLTGYSQYLILAAVGLSAYSNTFFSSFHFDDLRAIVRNPHIRDLFDLSALWNAFNTRFLVGLSLALNYALGGLNVVGYHVFNISAHILAACLVYQLIRLTLVTPALRAERSTGQDKTAALLGALIFLAHPLQTQAVTYIWQRAASLAAIFYLASLVFYIRWRLSRSSGFYKAGLVCVLLGMFCKENTITLPLSVALYEFCFLGKVGESREKRLWPLIPFFLTMMVIPLVLLRAPSITLDLMRPQFAESTNSVGLLDMTSFVDQSVITRGTYILTQLNVLRTYFRLLFFPVRQNLDYDYPLSHSFLEPHTLFSFFFLAAVFLGAVFLLKRLKLAGFGILWIFVTLSVESIVAQNDVLFEHRLYLPMVGFSLFLIGTADWLARKTRKPWVVLALLLPLASLYAGLTFRRNFVWENELTLWEDVIQKSPNKARAYQNRGVVYQNQGKIEEALQDFNKALELKPAYDRALYNRGNIYLNQNDDVQALRDFNRALEISPAYDKALNNRGLIYLRRGQYAKALADFEKAMAIDPSLADPYTNAALCHFYLKQYGQSWNIVHRLESAGGAVSSDLIQRLKQASGREA